MRGKVLCVIVCAFAVWGNAAAESRATNRDRLVTWTSMGRVSLGADEKEVLRAYGGAADVVEGMDENQQMQRAIVVRQGGKIVLEADLKQGWVRRLRTTDRRMVTEAGVGVGSSFAQIRRKYREFEIGSGEGGAVSVIVPHGDTGIAFGMSTDVARFAHWGTVVDTDRVTDIVVAYFD